LSSCLSSDTTPSALSSTLSLHDALPISYLCDEEMRARGRERGEDPDAQLRLSVKLIQATLSDRPRDLVVCTHLCRQAELRVRILDRKSTRLNSSHEWISYAVFCLKKKTI